MVVGDRRCTLSLLLVSVITPLPPQFPILVLRTFRKDCPAELALRASDDGLALVVRSFNDSHNHEISRVSNIFL